MKEYIRMGINGEMGVNRQFYGRKLRFTAPLTRRHKTKFLIIKPTIYLSK